MKKLLALSLTSALLFTGCLKQDVSITVIDQNKQAVETAAVTIESSKGDRMSLQSNEQGTAHLPLSKGNYKISVNKTNCEAKYDEVDIQVSKEETNFITELICK